MKIDADGENTVYFSQKFYYCFGIGKKAVKKPMAQKNEGAINKSIDKIDRRKLRKARGNIVYLIQHINNFTIKSCFSTNAFVHEVAFWNRICGQRVDNNKIL